MTATEIKIIDRFIQDEFIPHIEKPSDKERDRQFFAGVIETHGREPYFVDMMRAMVNIAFKHGKAMVQRGMCAVFPE